MLSKIAQTNNGAGGGGGGGRRVPLSLSSSGSTMSRFHQSGGSNGRSNSPQSSNVDKKKDANLAAGAFVSLKKTSGNQRSSTPNSAASSSSTSTPASSKDEERKNQNGASNKSANGSQKTTPQNGNSTNAAAVVEKVVEQKETAKVETKEEAAKPSKKETGMKVTEPQSAKAEEPKKVDATPPNIFEVIDLDKEPDVVVEPITPKSERKSSRKASTQKTPTKAEQQQPQQQQQPQSVSSSPARNDAETQNSESGAAGEDVEMESLAVDITPIKSLAPSVAQPTATSTPGRNLFGVHGKTKQSNEVELVAQPSSSPATVPARTYAEISGRRSIRPISTITPGKMGNYRSINTSDLDSSLCTTNTSMNATVGSEIPNNSSFSFSFFNRGRKRERTPPPLLGSQSATDLALDVDLSPPKRARFDFFSLNLASPFSLLRSRFSKTTISSPSARQRLDLTPSAGEDEDAEVGGEVLNVSGIVNQDEQQEQLNISSVSNKEEVTVAEEAGSDSPMKAEEGSPPKKDFEDAAEDKKLNEDKGDVPVTDAADVVAVESEGPNRSRCAIM